MQTLYDHSFWVDNGGSSFCTLWPWLALQLQRVSSVSAKVTQASKGLDVQFYTGKSALMAGRAGFISDNRISQPWC